VVAVTVDPAVQDDGFSGVGNGEFAAGDSALEVFHGMASV
jgi:hypothetical protein